MTQQISIEEKIAWVRDHLNHLRPRIVAEDDVVHKAFLMRQEQMFESILDDLIAVRLWNKVNNTEQFDWHILKKHDN